MKLYAHPFSSYCQKVLIALYENATPFELRNLEDPAASTELEALWPLKRFPVLVDDGHTILESSSIIEYLDGRYPGPQKMIPVDPATALEARTMDRIFDNYIMTPMQKPVIDALRPEGDRDPYGVTEARGALDKAYLWLDKKMAERPWAAGSDFSIADCAAAPSLFYADWVQEIGDAYPHLRAYRARLLARPSFARAVDEARPFRHYFPLGAPDRD
jgi:glutathione S-transferase